MSLRRLAAIIVTTLFGAAAGLVFGFLNSGRIAVSKGFHYWITYPVDSVHWPVLGGLAEVWLRWLSISGFRKKEAHGIDGWPRSNGPSPQASRKRAAKKYGIVRPAVCRAAFFHKHSTAARHDCQRGGRSEAGLNGGKPQCCAVRGPSGCVLLQIALS